MNNLDPPTSHNYSHDFFLFALRWTPRALFAGVAGYYSLGVAYDKGVMAAIDRVAIKVFRHFWGYAGIGAFMPTFQWYSAWGVRIICALAAGILYDLAERIVLAACRALKYCLYGEPELVPAPNTGINKVQELVAKFEESDRQDSPTRLTN